MITEHQNSHRGDHESIYHCMILETLSPIIICTNLNFYYDFGGRTLTHTTLDVRIKSLLVVSAFDLLNEAIMWIQSGHGCIFQFSLENRHKNSSCF